MARRQRHLTIPCEMCIRDRTNTLILAYIGSSLPTLLLLVIYSRPYLQIANSEYVAHEVIQAIAGSLGILFTIPITSILSAFFLQRHQTKSLKG